MVYLYDESDAPIGLLYRESTYAEEVFDEYYFTKNLQGDIIGIYDVTGNIVASYAYDAWGNHSVYDATGEIVEEEQTNFIGNINPFRYRGYYFDQETNFYYLNSRYYDSNIKRFINADSCSYLGIGDELQSFNLYSYCGNNPVMGYDPMGTWNWKSILKASLIVVAVAAVAAAAVFTGGAALAAAGVITASTAALTSAAAVTAGAAIAAGTMNIIDQTQEKSKDEELDFADVSLSSKAGAARGFATVATGNWAPFISALVSAGESSIRSSRAGATEEEIIESANRAFVMSLFSYGMGKGLDTYFGTKFIAEITGGEIFGGIMNLGN